MGFKKTMAFQPRVIKQNRGSSGEGIWIIKLKEDGTETCKDFIRFLEWVLGTLPKTNGLPRKIGRAPEGNDSIPSIHFQVRPVSVRVDRSWDVYAIQIQEIAEIHMFFFGSGRGFEGVSS